MLKSLLKENHKVISNNDLWELFKCKDVLLENEDTSFTTNKLLL